MPRVVTASPVVHLILGPVKFRYAPLSTYPTTTIPSKAFTEEFLFCAFVTEQKARDKTNVRVWKIRAFKMFETSV